MKRHECFIELSRDHHDGLMLAVRLQQGKRALLRLWSHDPEWQAAYVVRFFQEHLQKHFQIEEELVFPLAERYLRPEDNVITDRLRAEHGDMKMLVETLRTPPTTPVETVLSRFGQILERHIHTEEREFFSLCEKYVPDDVLTRLVASMATSQTKGGA
jgi:hemerythrin-like domain-containing protein